MEDSKTERRDGREENTMRVEGREGGEEGIKRGGNVMGEPRRVL